MSKTMKKLAKNLDRVVDKHKSDVYMVILSPMEDGGQNVLTIIKTYADGPPPKSDIMKVVSAIAEDAEAIA